MLDAARVRSILKQYHATHSVKYLLKLKSIGDWLLKKNVRALIEHALLNDCTLLGVEVKFSHKVLARCMAGALLHRSEEKFRLYERIMHFKGQCFLEASGGNRISALIDIVGACPDGIWWNRAVSWMGPRKMRSVLQKAIQVFRLDVVRRIVEKSGMSRLHEQVRQWEKGVLAVSEPMSEERAEVAMSMYRLLESFAKSSTAAVSSCFVSVTRHGSVPLLRKFHSHHKTIPGPLNLVLRAALRRPQLLSLLHEWSYVCPNMQNTMLIAAYTNNVDAMLYMMELCDFEPDSSHVAAAIRGHASAALHVLFCCFRNFRSVPKVKVDIWGLLSARHCSVSCMNVLLNHFDAFSTHAAVHALRVERNTSDVPIPQHMHVEFGEILHRILSKLPPPQMRRCYKQTVIGKLIEQSSDKPQCSICLDAVNKDTVHMLPCGHMFHSKCVAKCHKAQCPECREGFEFEFE